MDWDEARDKMLEANQKYKDKLLFETEALVAMHNRREKPMNAPE